MKSPDTLELDSNQRKTGNTIGFDPFVILKILKRYWYLFGIGVVLGLYGARFYIGHTLPVYETSATILINEAENRTMVDNTELLQGLGLPGGMQNIENQMMIIKSRDLTDRTLKQLPFEVEYYFKTFRNKLPIYPESPLSLVLGNEFLLPRNTEFSISHLGNNSFLLKSNADNYPLNITGFFGEAIEIARGSLMFECSDPEWFERNKDRELYFVIYSRNGLVNNYSNRIRVELVSRGGSVLKVSTRGTNPEKDADFINMQLENFQNISLDKKNSEADRRIQFIDDQLVGVSESLSSTESSLQQFRSSHRVMDLSVQGQAIIGQLTVLETELARLNLEANYFDYLSEYLNKDVSGEMPIVPITMGINDAGLTRLIDELATLQGQLSATGAGELNPLQKNLEQRVRATKEAVRETLNGLRRANTLARSEKQEQINKANAQASVLPVTERQLLGIERTFKLNDELYTFLLEIRAEQQMQKASNRADSEIIDRADHRYSVLISPDRTRIQFLGLFFGIGFPSLIILLSMLFRNKVSEEDIRSITTRPILCSIPKSDLKTNTVVFEDSSSNIAEAFRLLRSKMQFLTKETKSPIIMITSPMPGDGKTFVSINLASAYSLLGEKTVLLGFDLRKPKIYQDFGLKNEHGLTTWLIGQDKFDDIISESGYKNLFIIPAGPIPPNPSELTALGKTEELFKILKQNFNYIIMDTSPLGIVSDTYHLAAFADVSLLVVRENKSLRDMFIKTIDDISSNDLKSVSIVINDSKPGSKRYGYGEKYGYTQSKRRSKKSILKIHRK